MEEQKVFSQPFVIPVKEEKIKISLLEVQKLRSSVNLAKIKCPFLEINTSPLKQINKLHDQRSTFIVEPLYMNPIKDGVFSDTFHILEEIVLEVSLPQDNRLYPSLHCFLQEKETEGSDGQVTTLCVFELNLFEHFMEELIFQYNFLYSIQNAPNPHEDQELLKVLIEQQMNEIDTRTLFIREFETEKKRKVLTVEEMSQATIQLKKNTSYFQLFKKDILKRIQNEQKRNKKRATVTGIESSKQIVPESQVVYLLEKNP